MKRFIFVAHEMLSVARNINLDSFNPTYFEYQQLNETINNIENHCLGMLTKYIVVKNPETISRWHVVHGELYNQVYNEIGRARVALYHRGAVEAVELLDQLRLDIVQITDKMAGVSWN